MRVLLTFNDSYAPHAATVMESVLLNTTDCDGFVVIYMEGALSSETKDILRKHLLEKGVSIEFHSIGDRIRRDFSNVGFASYLSLNTFLRLYCGDIGIQDDLILYLDCDLIVQGDISELTKLVDTNFVVNAVAQYYPLRMSPNLIPKFKMSGEAIEALRLEKLHQANNKILDMSSYSAYFNAGVMVLNLRLWREQDILGKILEYCSNRNTLLCADQDALNGVLDGNFGLLPPMWNVFYYTQMMNESTSAYTIDELSSVRMSPKIIHFAGPYKAWEYLYGNSEHKKFYWKYRSLTPWPQKREEGRSLKNVFRKNINYVINGLSRRLRFNG